MARLGVDAVEAGRTRVVTGAANKLVAWVSRYVPDAISRALLAGNTRKFRDTD